MIKLKQKTERRVKMVRYKGEWICNDCFEKIVEMDNQTERRAGMKNYLDGKEYVVISVECGVSNCSDCGKNFAFTIKQDNINRCFDCWIKREVKKRNENPERYCKGQGLA